VKVFGMFITEGCSTHVTHPNASFTTAVNKRVAVRWMKFSRCDDFTQVVHVNRLEVHLTICKNFTISISLKSHNVEAFCVDSCVPQIDTQVI
jgi:hypothetical protein